MRDDLDRALSGEAMLQPSSGFVEAVMDAVRREAAAPAPIPFPWRRLALGLGACGLLIAIGSAGLLLFGPPALPAAADPAVAVERMTGIPSLPALTAGAAALLASLFVVRYSARWGGSQI